ncbi:MAG: isocitrate lyase/phosphoenolpyruvate mutase family protein, partial [Pseudomonadota bacterium]
MAHDPGSVFRALHRPGDPFILINVWEAGTARMAAAMGARALATSSAAHAFTLGRPDCGTLSRDEALAHAEEIVAATDLPVNGDFENGFGDDPETCAETVRLAAEARLRLRPGSGLRQGPPGRPRRLETPYPQSQSPPAP